MRDDTFWSDHVQQQKQSGLSIKNYCSSQGISQASFYQHRSRLMKLSPFVQLEIQQQPPNKTATLPSPTLTMTLDNRGWISVQGKFPDLQSLKQLLGRAS